MRTVPPLAKLRGVRGWTARELSIRADLTIETISRLEHGHRNPSPGTIAKLARALEMDFDELAALLLNEPEEAVS